MNEPKLEAPNTSPRIVKAETIVRGAIIIGNSPPSPNSTIYASTTPKTSETVLEIQETKAEQISFSKAEPIEEPPNLPLDRVDIVWPSSKCITPIKKKLPRVGSKPIVLKPFASLFATEDAVSSLRNYVNQSFHSPK